jgi:cytosine/adenosine deaminase-related metal-dependent hydrolase/ubiquinone/menaquinone biosynthesis C-methylase UbiE
VNTATHARFDDWAEVYDTQPNPLIQLEQRTLLPLMPSIKGLHVLDIGCGTGRWMKHFEHLDPSSLTGTDVSEAMLRRARAALAPTTALHLSDSTTVPVADVSTDLILASFVVSYLADLELFADECVRILRPGGYILLSDMHPVTASQRKWIRGFRHGGERVELSTNFFSTIEIIKAFTHRGLQLLTLNEPAFAEPEHHLFEQADKLAEYEALHSVPAIYLMKFVKVERVTRPAPHSGASCPSQHLSLVNTIWADTPDRWSKATLATTKSDNILDLSGYVLLPGLINAHDHLEFALFPNLSRPPGMPPFVNSTEWAEEIHRTHAELIQLHRQIPLNTRLWFGAIHNLLSGVTTVCHHNPLHPAMLEPDFPVRIVEEFDWAHSLAFTADIVDRFSAATEGRPFIVHAAEGTDMQSRNELQCLDSKQLLGSRTVLVHGLALTGEDINLVNRRGASVILCPTSNQFLFAQTVDSYLMSSIERAALGSDSPLTAAGGLLDEIAFLRTTHNIDSTRLYRLVTTAPAAILKLTRNEGRIVPDRPITIIAVRDINDSPANTLANLTYAGVELVMIEGQIQMASQALYDRLATKDRTGLHRVEVEGHPRWLRAPLPKLFASAEQFLGKDNLRLGNKEVRYRTPL